MALLGQRDILPDIPQSAVIEPLVRAELIAPLSALPMRAPSIDMSMVIEIADINFLLHHGSTQIEGALARLRCLAIFKIGWTS